VSFGRCAALALAAILGGAFPALAASAPAALGDLQSVLEELRKGGLVIYFRHAGTDPIGPRDALADLTRCETQRNLSAGGRAQATHIGNAFRALRIEVGTVTTSPFCRCKDTARLAFGRFTVDDDLYFAIGADAKDTRRFSRSLRKMLATVPSAASNAVIVSHSANLREAAGLWPEREGTAYVFRPWPGGEFEALAVVQPEDWDAAVATGASGKRGQRPAARMRMLL
jgi:phosphohistidine phosphatase SixA